MSAVLNPCQAFETATVAASGVAVWLYAHHHACRGDHAFLCYTVACIILYATAVACGAEKPLSLSASIFVMHSVSALGSTACYRLSPWHPLAGFPGPVLSRISSLHLVYISLMGKRYLVIDDLHRRFGPFVRIGPDQLSINLHSANGIIYGPANHMEKADSYTTPGQIKATALFFKQKTKAIHQERKRIWSSAFTRSSINNFIPAVERRTLELLDCIEYRQSESKEQLVDLSKVFCHWAYDIMGEIVFGGSNNLELMKNGDPAGLVDSGKMATVLLDSLGQSPWVIDLAWHLPLGNSMVRLRQVAAEMMRNRVRADADTTMRDLTSHLLDGRTSSGDAIPLADLELEAVVAIQGGSDNTSTTLSLAFYYMLVSPHNYYSKLRQEIYQAFPEQERDSPLDWDVLAGLPFLNAVVNEALRLASPYYLPRNVPPGGVIIDGTFVPEGTSLAIAAYSQQTSPENFYPDPLDFRVERWLPGGLGPGSRTEKAALYSFSSGPHVCIARSFAYQEMRCALARIVLSYNFKLVPNFDAKKYRDGILNMRTTLLKEPLLVRASRTNRVI
ncbi:cytochrome P450 [Mycena metata]|uniref:Cytochrome P450 n=1 Tax=Mycena metata TaxID=1033252 RepID=A0AAD7ME17_9AGAR|nr:cytochrome P450 [Mycena metata]